MKLAKTALKSAYGAPLPIFNKLLVGGLLASGLLVGCSSVDNKPNENPVPVVKTEVRSGVKSKVQQVGEKEAHSARLEKKAAQSQGNADALMATLVAPIEEPVSEEPVKAVVETVQASIVIEEKKPAKSILAAPEIKPKKKVERAKVKPQITKPVDAAAKPKPIKKKMASVNRGLSTKPLAIRKNDLPKTYDIWKLKQGVERLEQGIVVSTPTWEMGKEGYMSQIWLTLMEDQILVNSSSDIDQSAGAVGVKINGGELIPFTRIEDNNIGVLEGKWLDQLKVGGSMDIFLGFFPGKRPQSDVFKTDISLDSLSRVVPTYRNLLK